MKALVYCRVSTKEQTKNLSLPAQRKACREYCEDNGWTVDRVFVERGESAKTAERTELNHLLAYCRENRGRVQVMVVYSLDRFARNNYDHYAVRALLANLGMTLRSVTQPIDESPTGKLMEGVLAAIAQFDNDVRAEKTVTGMREALSRGRWTFQAPLGYRNTRRADGVTTIEPDPKRANLVRWAFETYATAEYKKTDVLRLANQKGLLTQRGNPVAPQTWDRMLQNPIYAGRIRLDKWGIDVEGDFEPLVDPITFQQVQSVLAGKGVAAWSRKKHHPDFPLRRFVRCGTCSEPLTASWSKSKSGKKYAYYRCNECRAISVRQQMLHECYEELLDRLKPKPELLRALRESVLAAWDERKVEVTTVRAHFEKRIARLEDRKQRLVETFVYRQAIDNETYLKELDKIREETTLAEMELHQTRLDGLDIETVLAFAEHVVVNAKRLWNEYDPRRKRHLQRVLFPEGLAFDGKSFGTPVTCLFFSGLEDFQGEKTRMASPTGFEPVLPA